MSPKEQVIKIVKLVPEGKITSYGRIANITGLSPRVVGFMLSSLSVKEAAEQEIPWHRVVDRNGFISSSKLGEKGLLQAEMLRNEGLEIKDYQIYNVENLWWNK